jgi:hypothetical protein
VLLAQLRQLHSLEPDPAVFKKWDEESKNLAVSLGVADTAKVARIIRLENAKNLNAEIPTHDDMVSFATLIKSVEKEQETALEWSESYEPAIKTHSLAAEHYEWGQLATEIGVVIASLALLFTSRKAWYVALIMVISTLAILSITFITVTTQMGKAEEEIDKAHKQFLAANDEKKGKAADEELLDAVEKDETPVINPLNNGSQPAEKPATEKSSTEKSSAEKPATEKTTAEKTSVSSAQAGKEK